MGNNTRNLAAPDCLRNLFAEKTLLDPRGGNGNAVDLIRMLANHFGVSGIELSPESRALEEIVAGADHVVFVLIDGLGINLLDRLDPTGFFQSGNQKELRALAPSTTACVLTALATGAYPSDHGITGWFTHLPEHSLTTIPLPFLDRATGEPLNSFGIEPTTLFPLSSILPRMKARVRCLFPSAYWDSPYTRYWRGNLPAEGYDEIETAVDRIPEVLRSGNGQSFTYMYLPLVDEVSHMFGPGSEEALASARFVEREMERLASDLPKGTRLLCTADHGQIHIPTESRFLLFDGDPLLNLLQAPPSGEDRFPLFHVRNGRENDFRELFNERYAPHFLLLSTDEIEEIRIVGPGPLAPITRSRIGDFAAVATGPRVLGYYPPEKDPASHHLGRHGGLSPDEMRVPLLWNA